MGLIKLKIVFFLVGYKNNMPFDLTFGEIFANFELSRRAGLFELIPFIQLVFCSFYII